MENFSFHYPVIVAKQVATDKHVADLAPLEVGIIDRKTNSVATSAGNGKEFYLAYGSPHTKDQLTKYYNGMKAPKKSEFFLGKEMVSFEVARPQRPENEEWVLGYGGAKDDNTLVFECGKDYQFKVTLYGEPAFGKFNKTVERIISYQTPCCDDSCSADCDTFKLDVKEHTRKLAEVINNDVELREFKLHAQPVFSDFSTTSANSYYYTLTVPDNGDAAAQFAVERAYSKTYQIKRISYVNGKSTYEVGPLASLPTAFTPTSSVLLTACDGTCPSGYTVSPVEDVWMISRPLAGTEDLSTANLRQTYANTVAASYFGKTFNATTAVDDSTETITTPTAHGFSAGQAVVFSVATGLIVGGITAGTTYYVISAGLTSTNFRVSTTRGGSAVNLTDAVGTNTVTPAGTVFLNQTGDVANIKVTLPDGTAVAALLADSVVQLASTIAECTPAAESSVAWVQSQAGYTTTRTLEIVVRVLDCTEAIPDTVADIVASLSNSPSYVADSATDATDVSGSGLNRDYCIKRFQITQTSHFMKDECQSPDVAEYDVLPSYKGYVWAVPAATPAAYDATIAGGIRISAPFYSVSFGDCSFQPEEYWDNQPLRMNISTWNQDGNNCLFGDEPVGRKVKDPKYQRLFGEGVIRHYIKGSGYFKFMNWEAEPRIREVIDSNYLSVVKRNAYYVAYYLKFKSSKGEDNFDTKGEYFEPVIYVEEGDLTTQLALENAIQAISTKWGVTLQERI